MSVAVGTLLIDLRAETASFSSEMSKAAHLSAKTANDIKRSLEKIAAVGLAMGAAVATGTAEVIRGAIDSVFELGKLAQAAGTTSQRFAELKYAAGLAGVESEGLAKGMERLSKNAFLAQNGNLQVERVFSRLGVSVVDAKGKLQDSGVMMDKIAVKFASMKDGAGKTALAYALFSRQGPQLIPFLDQYGAHMAAMNQESHALGLIPKQSTFQLAGNVHDDMVKWGDALKGVGYTILGETLPALEKLGDKAIRLFEDPDMHNLEHAFGAKVATAITVTGNALEFAAHHARALLMTMEAIAGLKVAAIAIPVIGDLASGGIAKVGEGITRFVIGLTGVGKVLPVLARFGAWAKDAAQFAMLLASEEGIASAAAYVLGGALTAVGGPIGVAIGAIAGLAVAIYKFRDSTFMLGKNTYELRDIWSASWMLMGKALGWVKNEFLELVGSMRKLWSEFTSWFGASWIVEDFKAAFGEAFTWAENILGKLTPKVVIDALNEAKKRREDREKGVPSPKLQSEQDYRPTPDISGLSSHPDYYADEIRKLDEAIAAQKAYLGVLDATPEKIQQVNAEEKAQSAILALNKQLIDEGMPALNARQHATIEQKTASAESTAALVDYGRELVDQQHSTELATRQAMAMAAANLEGDAAIRRVTVDNAILALSFNKTAEQLRTMSPEVAKLRSELMAKANIDLIASTNKEIDGMRDQLAERQILTRATLEGIDAQRQAELQAKLFTLDQNIGEAEDPAARGALIEKRNMIASLAQAQWDANDAEQAASLLSPAEQYASEADALNHAVTALSAMRDGTLSYGEQLELAAKQQQMFNDATDKTIQLLLGEGSATDGVKAFFLEMQKQGPTTASILYDTFTGAFNKLADGLTGIMTAANGYKRREARAAMMASFQDLSKQMLDSTLKKGMQSGLGALGNAFGINLGSMGKPDGSSSGKALWVRMASDSGGPLNNFGQGSGVAGMLGLGNGAPGSPTSGANIFSSIGSKIAGLFGMGKKSSGTQAAVMPDTTAIGLDELLPMSQGAVLPQSDMFADMGGDQTNSQTVRPPQSNAGGIFSQIAGIALQMLIPHADGGLVSPSSAYLVGERGPEILAGASGRIFSNAESRRMLSGSGGDTHHWNIDARGSNDPAQITAHLDRYMQKMAPQIAATVFHAVKDQPMRRPATAAR